MNTEMRMHPLLLVISGAAGVLVGYLAQVWRSGQGMPPLVPPYSLPATVAVISFILITLAVKLGRALNATSKARVNPFHAVRLLAGARAAQLTGVLVVGFLLGLMLQLLQRSVPAGTHVWVPMVVALASGVLLCASGFYAERACRVPPEDGESDPTTGPGEPDATPEGLAARNHSSD